MKQITITNPFRKYLTVLALTTFLIIGIAAPPVYYVTSFPTPTAADSHRIDAIHIPQFIALPIPPLRVTPVRVFTYQELASKASKECRVSLSLINAIVHFESTGNPKAVSPTGAYGWMQLTKQTGKHMKVDRYDPAQNLVGGACYFRQMMKKYNSTRVSLWAYNVGPGNVDAGIVPESTKKYAEKIMERAGVKE